METTPQVKKSNHALGIVALIMSAIVVSVIIVSTLKSRSDSNHSEPQQKVAQENSGKAGTYTDSDDLFSLTYPAGWKAEKSSEEGFLVKISNPEAMGHVLVATLYIEDIPDSVSDSKDWSTINITDDRLPDSFSVNHIKEYQDALKRGAVSRISSPELIQDQYMFVDIFSNPEAKRMWNVLVQSSPRISKAYEAEIESIVESVEFNTFDW